MIRYILIDLPNISVGCEMGKELNKIEHKFIGNKIFS